jgi:hypothetical protein
MGSCAVIAGLLGCKAVAFEPDPHNYILADLNIRYNKLSDLVTLIPCAAAAEEKRSVVYAQDGVQEAVQTVQLDQIVHQPVNFLQLGGAGGHVHHVFKVKLMKMTAYNFRYSYYS